MTSTGAEQMIVNGASFDPTTTIHYTKPKVNASGGKSVGILNKNTNKGFYINTPLMLTWGINEYVDEPTGKRTYDMSLQFPRQEYSTETLDQFLTNLKDFENKIKEDAMKNSKEWLNKPKMSKDVCEALWTPMLKYPKYPEGHENHGEFDYTRSPTLRVKVPFWEGEWKFELYDMEENLLFPNDNGVLPTELVQKGVNIATVIQCGGIWFAAGKFGVTWKLFQGVVKPKPSMKGKCLISLSDTDRSVLEKADNNNDDTSFPVSIVDDSDDSDQEAESKPNIEPEPEVVTEPVVETKKKVVRKKKTISSNDQ